MSEAQVQEQEEVTQDPATADPPEKQEDQEVKTNGDAATQTIATGADTEAEKAKEEEETKPYWPDDWREKMAEHYAAGDDKAYKKELKRLQRFTDPTAVYGMGREAESKLTSGQLAKLPGENATDEEKLEFWKSLGGPEKPEELAESVELENGATLGDADKPVLEDFAKAVHGSTTPQEFMNKAANWYFQNQEEQAAQLDESDDKFRQEAEQALKEEYGPSYRRYTNAIPSLFATAPGGTDLENENSLYARLMGGRMADGKIIGNDPDMVRLLVSLAQDVNPSATVVEDGDQSGKSVEAEIQEIEKRMREDRRGYFKDEAAQQRYRELIEARDKIQAKRSA